MKETKELAVGFITLAALLAASFKDGVQVADLSEIYAKMAADPILKEKIVAAYKDIELVKEEVKEVTVVEVLEVITACLPEIQKLIEAIKK